MGKLWASVRKEIFRQYGVDMVGLFTYDYNSGVIMGTFDPNFAVALEEGITQEQYQKRFEEKFWYGMGIFSKTVTKFLKDEKNGYAPYCRLIRKRFEDDYEGPSKREQLDEMLNRFLASIGIRAEEKKRKKHAQKQ